MTGFKANQRLEVVKYKTKSDPIFILVCQGKHEIESLIRLHAERYFCTRFIVKNKVAVATKQRKGRPRASPDGKAYGKKKRFAFIKWRFTVIAINSYKAQDTATDETL